MNVRWALTADRNLDDQLDYIAERDPHAAVRMNDVISASVHRLTDHPHSGRPGRVANTRELVVPGTPFVIVYEIGPESVNIIRFLHGAQRWP